MPIGKPIIWGRIAWIAVVLAMPLVTANAAPSVARVWNEAVLNAIRIDIPNPPVHARNLFHLSVAMYDVWAAYDPSAVGYLYHAKHTASDIAAARRQAISFAAYRILRERYALSRNAEPTLTALDATLKSLGYDPLDESLDPSRPAGVGNRVALMVSTFFFADGARQAQRYQDFAPNDGGYVSTNLPLLITVPGTLAADINRWQPLAITDATTQNGIPTDSIQKFLGAHWRNVQPFALQRAQANELWIDPGPPPQLNGAGDAQFRQEVVEIIRLSNQLTPDDGVIIDISPGAFGNNSLGRNDGTGHSVNPQTGRAYAPNRVRRGDFSRVLAEFWADGPNSETPPGHWNSMANAVSDDPAFARRVSGSGPVLDELEWDVKLYFALNGALHDAACVAWSVKRHYDGWRPIAAVRYMAQQGQSSDPNLPRYHPSGLPLISDLIELVTTNTWKSGERHFGLHPGQIAIRCWPGQPENPTNNYSGVRWMDAALWFPYQKKTFVTPAFPGYISGHSTFSRAAAEVLTAMTGSPFFPGGLAAYDAPAARFLTAEQGPSQGLQLQWATYFDAADQAGLSRLWGGIHVPADDFTGRQVGAACGQGAWTLARQYFDGSITNHGGNVTVRRGGTAEVEFRFESLRGFIYNVQGAVDVEGPYRDVSFNPAPATDSTTSYLLKNPGTNRFFRVAGRLTPAASASGP